MNTIVRLTNYIRTKQAAPDAEAGVETIEILAWMAMSVVAIVAMGAVLQTLGVDVLNYVRDQIGV
jgi:hypothetical protein